jgi:hypothetical protein
LEDDPVRRQTIPGPQPSTPAQAFPSPQTISPRKAAPLNTAIRYLKKGEWQKAHEIAQQDESKFGCWAHGIVHLVEGDLGNARYWYRRAGRPFPKDRDVDHEVAELTRALKSTQGE